MFFDEAYAFTSKWEGGFSDNKYDAGGVTKYGISLVFLRDFVKEFPYTAKQLNIPEYPMAENIRGLDRKTARAIMRKAFWDKMRCVQYPSVFAFAVFDCGVNSGCARSIRIAQQSFNKNNPDKTQLVVDGILGPKSLNAFHGASKEMALTCIDLREDFLNGIVKSRPTQKVFLKGWLNRTADLRKYITSYQMGLGLIDQDEICHPN